MIFKAILSNKAKPGYGQVTIPFPIPDTEYDHTIDLLEPMDIGSPTAQDCRVEALDSEYPILKRLVAQSVNVDELDYLAKRLGSFCQGESEKFQAMASKLGLSDIKDFINLTFSCQQATVITDFTKLEQAGKDHALTINGGGMPVDAFEKVDGLSAALDLIQSGAGTVTPYGVVYGNGMELEQVYDGRHFPAFYYEDSYGSNTPWTAESRSGRWARAPPTPLSLGPRDRWNTLMGTACSMWPGTAGKRCRWSSGRTPSPCPRRPSRPSSCICP